MVRSNSWPHGNNLGWSFELTFSPHSVCAHHVIFCPEIPNLIRIRPAVLLSHHCNSRTSCFCSFIHIVLRTNILPVILRQIISILLWHICRWAPLNGFLPSWYLFRTPFFWSTHARRSQAFFSIDFVKTIQGHEITSSEWETTHEYFNKTTALCESFVLFAAHEHLSSFH